jgi:hypothetical protein
VLKRQPSNCSQQRMLSGTRKGCARCQRYSDKVLTVSVLPPFALIVHPDLITLRGPLVSLCDRRWMIARRSIERTGARASTRVSVPQSVPVVI